VLSLSNLEDLFFKQKQILVRATLRRVFPKRVTYSSSSAEGKVATNSLLINDSLEYNTPSEYCCVLESVSWPHLHIWMLCTCLLQLQAYYNTISKELIKFLQNSTESYCLRSYKTKGFSLSKELSHSRADPCASAARICARALGATP
jgi:hypothetical protein